MKNVIYQYWDGEIRVGCRAGVENMKQYAKRIGADYIFEDNPCFIKNREFGGYSPHYGAFKPIYTDSFYEYDNVLFADTDIFAVDGLTENIFEQADVEIGICTEPDQPKLRIKTAGRITSALDEKWAQLMKTHYNIDVPRTEDGLVKVYNSGVVLYSNAGMQKAKERFVPFRDYVNLIKNSSLDSFYLCDQPYLHAMLDYCEFNWKELDNGWNSYIHYARQRHINNGARYVNDTRSPTTKFVHIQLAGADDWDADKLWRVTNLPQNEWNI